MKEVILVARECASGRRGRLNHLQGGDRRAARVQPHTHDVSATGMALKREQ